MLNLPVRHTRLGLLAIAWLMIASGCIAGSLAAHEDTFQVGKAPVLVVENGNGEVRVAAGQPGSIDVVAAVSHGANVEYSAAQSKDTVTVRAKTRSPLLGSPRTDMAITVPPETSVTIHSGNGLVSVKGLRAAATIVTGNGPVGLTDVEGSIGVTTGNGRIVVEGGVGSFDLTSGNGDIVFQGVLSPGTESNFDSGNGPVTVEFDGPQSVAVDAESKSGRVRSELELSTTTRSEKDHLVGMIGDGAASLHIRAGNGDIAVR